MFSREFNHEDVLCLWDSIFGFYCQYKNYDFLDYIALSMIKKVRSKIFKEDDSAMALQVFLKYPKTSDSLLFVKSAYQIKSNFLILINILR